MDLLYDTQKLRILLEKDQKINLGKGKVDTFKRDGYQSVSLYTKRLIEMCSYEFQIEAAKALFGKLSDDYKECRLQRLKNKTFSDFADGELNEDDGELNRGSNDIDGSSAEKWVLYGEPEMYSYNDIVVAIATKSFGDETVSVRYIGCLGRISRVPQTSLRKYIFTFNAQISPSKEIDVLMWTVGNLTSYKRVVDSLSNQDAMKSIPKLFLRAPATDINPLTDGTTDIQDGVPERMNLAQKVAISRAIQKDGDDVVLVQGPPGCGKSTMIVEMVRLLTSHGRGNAGMQVLVCAQTNVAVADLAYKYVTHNEFKGKFDCVMDMRPPKIADRHKRDTLEPFTVTARYHQVVNAVLHVIIRDFEHIPTTCHGSTTRERVMNIVASDFNACVESGLLMLLSGRATLLMSIKTADLTRMKRLILGMRNELEPFFKPDDLSLLLEQCSAGQYTDTSRPESFPIYGWVRQALLSAATVIFCTINVGISVTSKKFLGNLAYIVVDEAAQALEPDVTALMCIDSCFRRLILVGDPQQLPGYCASNRGKQQMMDRSLMERLEEYQLCHFTLLDVQYRMHQSICDFVSRTFYKDRLTSHETIHSRSPITTLSPVMHVMFLGSRTSQSTITTTSVVNIEEARYIVAHVFNVLLPSRQKQTPSAKPVTESTPYATVAKNTEKTKTRQPIEAATISVGIICIYKAQANVIRYLVDKFKKLHNVSGIDILVNTIDSFQGQERDVIYVALTRTTQINTFMDNANRVNVAISRARHHIIVVGDEKLSLTSEKDASSSYWHSLCVGRSSMVVDPNYLKDVPQYDGPEHVTHTKAEEIPVTPAAIKKLIAKGLAATTPIWAIHYERLMVDSKIPQGIHILEYVVQTLASGDFDAGKGGSTTRPLFRKQKGTALFFVTTVCGTVYLAWTVKVYGQCQAIELLGIGGKTFVEKRVWPLLRRDIEEQPEWKLPASMSLWSSGASVDLSKDMPEDTSLLYVPADIDVPANDALVDVSENAHLLIDQSHIKAMSFMRSRPTMVLGGGGTGKTECMLDMIEQQLDTGTGFDNMQLYVGATDSLANWSSMRLLKRETITEEGFRMVSFTSLPSLLAKLYMSNNTIRGRLFVDRNIFRSEYMDVMPKMVRSIGADELYDAIHAHMDIEAEGGVSSLRPEYKKARKVYESVKASRGHIDAYDLHTLVKQDPQRLVAMASKIARIYLDEVQDISWTMWSVIEIMLSARTSSVVCAGDFTQRLTPGISINGIKTLIYKHLPKSMEIVRYKINYRSDPSIISLANRIQSYTHMREHAMEPSPYTQETSNSVTLVEIQDIEHENVADVLRYIGVPSNNYRAAIVTTSSWAHRLRETLGKSHNVFSAYECKGLEFDLVVCWDLFNPSMGIKAPILKRSIEAAALNKGNIDEYENFEIYLNHLYITVTRARKHLIMVVPPCERSSIMIKALGIDDIVYYSEVRERGPLPEITIPIDELSAPDDLRMAIVMRERGLLQQALNVFEQNGDAVQAGFTRALIHRKQHRLRGEHREIQLCISECYGVIEALKQSTDSVLKIEDVKLLLAQALVVDKQYAEACLLYEDLEMEDELVACLIEAVESKSGDVMRIRYLIPEKAVAIWEHFKDNNRYARFVVALMLAFEPPSVDLVQSMISHIPSKAGLIMMHNSLVEVDESVFPTWDVFRKRKLSQMGSGSEESELTFLEWSLLRRLDGQHSNEDLVYIISTGCLPKFQSSMACLFVGPRNSKTTELLSLHIQSGAMLKAYRSLEMPLKHVATKMRELSCPLTDFMALHSQIPSEEESRVHLLAEAYKTHMLKMRGSEHQLTLFRWCAKMSGGMNIIEMICTMLKEDKQMLLGIYSPDNTVNATQRALLRVLSERYL